MTVGDMFLDILFGVPDVVEDSFVSDVGGHLEDYRECSMAGDALGRTSQAAQQAKSM